MSDADPLDGWTVVVLAGGRGARMRSAVTKMLHPVAGTPMIRIVCEQALEAGVADVIAVVGEQAEDVTAALPDGVRAVTQAEPLGTGHAALTAREAAGEVSHVLIVSGDAPLLTAATLRSLAEQHVATQATLTLLTASVDEPAGYGRIVRRDGAITEIVEEVDATAEILAGCEVNVGLYAARAAWLWETLDSLPPSASGEIYLTDAVRSAITSGQRVESREAPRDEVRQVNTRVELAEAERLMRERIARRLMLDGVTIVDPANTYIDRGVSVGADTTLLPGTHLRGATAIGGGCRIGPNAVLTDTRTGDRCVIGGATLDGAELHDEVEVGAYCRLRPGAVLERGVHLGTHAEVKNSRIGAGTRIGHFSYIGDADVGANVNIGAGVITVNYDGERKHRTRIGDGAFIGSDSMIVAPLTIGEGARTAAGSVVTKDVPAGALAVGAPARMRTREPRAGGASEGGN